MTAHLFILRGLPASGKSSLAQAMLSAGLVDAVVTRDDIRQSLQPGRRFVERDRMSDADREFERDTLFERNAQIRAALGRGKRVVSADTNISGTAMRELHALADTVGAPVTVVTIRTPVDVCIERDAAREYPVGEAVIRRMASDWHWQRS